MAQRLVEVTVLRGVAPHGYGNGSSDGYGNGYGYGSGDGSGYGSGYGSGDGYGDGYDYGSGYGHGSGYGYGDGSGDGHSSGYGNSSGYGYGYGHGSGYGYGDGCSDGYGDGSGDGSDYWERVLESALAQLPAALQKRAYVLRMSGAKLAFWRSDTNGAANNGGKNTPVAPGTVERENGPLRDTCGTGQLHATLMPNKWKGERWWIVALIGDVRGDDEKYWALEREVIGEIDRGGSNQ